MNDTKLRGLVFDVNVLVYIHDILFILDHDENFIYTNTYRQIFESRFVTIIKYLQKTIYVLLSFWVATLLMKMYEINTYNLKYFFYLFVSVVYGTLFVSCKEDFSSLKYQLKAKKAVQYAISHYNYQQFVLFLDKYLSEESTKNYIHKRI